jgi:biopolymer transport protein ExbB/TolQ
MSIPHVLLSIEQYNRLKQKNQEYEKVINREKSEENKMKDKQKSQNNGSIENQESEKKFVEDKSVNKRELKQTKKKTQPKVSKKKKESITREKIIKMFTPPGEHESERNNIKTIKRSIKNNITSDKRKWVSI